MKQKQNQCWQICYSKGILDNSKGPFFSTRHPGSTIVERTFRVFIFMLGVLAASQLLNLIQTYFISAETTPIIYGQNLIRDSISQGYYGDYFNYTLPANGSNSITESQNFVALSPEVLSARTYRSQADAAGSEAGQDFQAELVSQNYQGMKIITGRAFTFEVSFRNTGKAIWRNFGDHFIAINVTDPVGRHSTFQSETWKEYYYRPARLKEKEVKPGEIGTFRFALSAPSTPGEYTENFNLVAENLTWITGGYVSIPITVVPPPPPYRAEVRLSESEITADPGEDITVWADIKNTGTATWTNTGDHFIALNVTDPVGRHSAFQHETWSEFYYRPGRLDNASVKPGETSRVTFTLKAPLQPGNYNEAFGLVAENLTWLEGGTIALQITVVKPEADEQPNESEVRVGLFAADELVQLTADTEFNAVDDTGTVLKSFSAGTQVDVTYSNNQYHLKSGETNLTVTDYIRFVGQKESAVFELVNYENRPEWNPSLNDNKYRGEIEIHYAEGTKKLWVINELPLEQYLRGVAEAANDDNPEYLKALIIAERTYAQYHLNTGTKHADENYTIDALNDQVYRGYNFELRAPSITKYINETVGSMVTYNDEVVVTPYFSHSDGRTRAWEEVWSGGPYPWLQSVSDPASLGLEMLGHGVGLSALGARQMADNDSTYDEILKYFYQGIDIKKIY